MSNLEPAAVIEVCGNRAGVTGAPEFEVIAGRPVVLTPRQRVGEDGRLIADPMTVSRYLPSHGRRMVGAWCFIDYYGPDDVSATRGMQVPPHPHCGLQTVSWLLAGEVLHRDSLGKRQLIVPGELALMTAGRGIAHAETSPTSPSRVLHGAQLWVALPAGELDRTADFEHHADLPRWRSGQVSATVMLGRLGEISSPATIFSPLVGAELTVTAGAEATVPLVDDWEHAILVLDGAAELAGHRVEAGQFAYLGSGRDGLAIGSELGARMLLVGGEPFEEQIVMWWNFIGRSHDDISEARRAWMSGERFGTVDNYPGDRLPAPPMPPVRLKPRGRE